MNHVTPRHDAASRSRTLVNSLRASRPPLRVPTSAVGGWHKQHDYAMRVGSVDPSAAEASRPFWAMIESIFRYTPHAETSWQHVEGWPGHQVFGETEDAALFKADAIAKAWIEQHHRLCVGRRALWVSGVRTQDGVWISSVGSGEALG